MTKLIEKEDEADNSDVRAARRPNNYSLDDLERTDAPQDVPAPEFGQSDLSLNYPVL